MSTTLAFHSGEGRSIRFMYDGDDDTLTVVGDGPAPMTRNIVFAWLTDAEWAQLADVVNARHRVRPIPLLSTIEALATVEDVAPGELRDAIDMPVCDHCGDPVAPMSGDVSGWAHIINEARACGVAYPNMVACVDGGADPSSTAVIRAARLRALAH